MAKIRMSHALLGEGNFSNLLRFSSTKSVNFLPYCIERREICDGISQCPNGHDEDPRVCGNLLKIFNLLFK